MFTFQNLESFQLPFSLNKKQLLVIIRLLLVYFPGWEWSIKIDPRWLGKLREVSSSASQEIDFHAIPTMVYFHSAGESTLPAAYREVPNYEAYFLITFMWLKFQPWGKWQHTSKLPLAPKHMDPPHLHSIFLQQHNIWTSLCQHSKSQEFPLPPKRA